MTDTTTTTTVALSPTRSRINVDSPVDNANYDEGMALFVTSNDKGSLRAIGAPAEAFAIGQEFEAVLGGRKAKLGTLTVVGTVVEGEKAGNVGEKSLPFRLLG